MEWSQQEIVPIWYIPSFFGDVRLEVDSEGAGTVVVFSKLSPIEEVAVSMLKKRSIDSGWAALPDFAAVESKTYRETEVRVRLLAPIAKVAKVLSRAMKPGRKTISAVRFSDGTMEEIHAAPTTALVREKGALARVVKAAVTVATPTIGCPILEFEQAEIRARRVLDVFLNEQQRGDLHTSGRFVTTGQDTGRRYLLSLRDRPGGLARTGGRGVYDLDPPGSDAGPEAVRIDGYRSGELCIHDWTVPAAEEMLAVLVCLSVPGMERHIRSLPEV